MEVREDFMLSPAGDSEPTLRTAYFLKPIANSTSEEIPLPSSSVSPPMFEIEPKELPLTIHFNGWHHPQKKWVGWVDALKPRYESLWKKAGIFEAIMSTKCFIVENKNLVFGVVEKWCPETNTFVFPWIEATITLEDVLVLGGYPVLGDPVFTPLENHEMREVEEKMVLKRQEFWRSKKGRASTSQWMNMFIDSGSEIEHEAFLATWLSIFVFPHNSLVKRSLFPIAVQLARGNPIALAPAVLASIYKDLGVFKETIVGLSSTKYPEPGGDNKWSLELEATLRSPFYLVQIWVWERFKNLQPEPNLISNGDPVLFRWNKVKSLKMKTENVRLELDSAMDDFLWRPYVRYADNCKVLFYPKDENLVPLEAGLDKELLSFVTCLRVSELVGTDSIEQYLPHRVSMQFGMDQDVPGHVLRFNETKAIAWENYCRPIYDRNLYFPPRFFEADVTTRYARWWKQSVLCHHDFDKNIARQKRSARSRSRSRSSKFRPLVGKANRSGHHADVPPGFPPKLVGTSEKSCDDGSKTGKGDNVDVDVPSDFIPSNNKRFKIVPFENSVQDGLKADEKIDADASTSKESRLPSDGVCLSGSQGESDSSESETKGMELEQRISRLERVITKLKMERFGHS